MATAVGCLFIDRSNKEQKVSMMSQISEMQKACEKKEFPPLIIYPEGGTTNGKSLINFKKGAFAGLHSI